MDSIALHAKKLRQGLASIILLAVMSACGSKQVIVQGSFPSPIMEPLPLTLGVLYPDAFTSHEFFDEASGPAEIDWRVNTGAAQVQFWDTLFDGMFERVVHIRNHDDLHQGDDSIDAVIIPSVADLQYTVPTHTNIKIYEIWMRYRFRLVALDAIHDHDNGDLTYNPANSFADWQLSAYGKTPTAFMQSDEAAVNLAAVMALRDAGAHFITSFGRVPEITQWLDSREGLQ